MFERVSAHMYTDVLASMFHRRRNAGGRRGHVPPTNAGHYVYAEFLFNTRSWAPKILFTFQRLCVFFVVVMSRIVHLQLAFVRSRYMKSTIAAKTEPFTKQRSPIVAHLRFFVCQSNASTCVVH